MARGTILLLLRSSTLESHKAKTRTALFEQVKKLYGLKKSAYSVGAGVGVVT